MMVAIVNQYVITFIRFIIKSLAIDDSAENSPWLVLCDESPVDATIKSLCTSHVTVIWTLLCEVIIMFYEESSSDVKRKEIVYFLESNTNGDSSVQSINVHYHANASHHVALLWCSWWLHNEGHMRVTLFTKQQSLNVCLMKYQMTVTWK